MATAGTQKCLKREPSFLPRKQSQCQPANVRILANKGQSSKSPGVGIQ
jgi:hypothetical protein